MRARLRPVLAGLAVTTLAAAILAAAAPARAQATCAAPVPSDTQPGYSVADPWCDFPGGAPFAPLADPGGAPLSQVHAGIEAGAAWRVELPERWNGELVLHAHGFRGGGTTVWVDNPSLRAHLVRRGFAWAASSYQTNGYDVGQGVRDTHALIDLFRRATGLRTRKLLITGPSMGGHVTAVAVEHFRHTFAGAMPVCGVLGDTRLFDYFTDANVTAAALTGTPISFPLRPPPDYPLTYQRQVLGELPQLGSGFAAGTPPSFTPLGRRWGAAVEQRSGGTRPGFGSAFAYWNSFGFPPLTAIPFLFGLYPGLSGGTIGVADGNVVDNRRTVYQLDGDPRLSAEERRLNATVLRVAATAKASEDLSGIPAVKGDPRIPVLSLHGLGDLFVPFSMEQAYARRTLLHGQRGLFVSRAIRATGHCDFTQAELRRGFDDLVRWVHGGRRPAGDPVLSRTLVARPAFGCRFTDGRHANFSAPACP
jgi:Prolyl oligopeptidase family